jgi:hypothetical protein
MTTTQAYLQTWAEARTRFYNLFPTFIIYRQGKETWRKQGLVEVKEFIQNF